MLSWKLFLAKEELQPLILSGCKLWLKNTLRANRYTKLLHVILLNKSSVISRTIQQTQLLLGVLGSWRNVATPKITLIWVLSTQSWQTWPLFPSQSGYKDNPQKWTANKAKADLSRWSCWGGGVWHKSKPQTKKITDGTTQPPPPSFCLQLF